MTRHILYCVALMVLISTSGFAQYSVTTNTESETRLAISSDVRFSSSAGDNRKEASAGTGSLGIKFQKKFIYGSVQFNVLSKNEGLVTSDSLEKPLFGKKLLIPGDGEASLSNFYFALGCRSFESYDSMAFDELPFLSWKRIGAYGLFSSNSMEWRNDSITIPVVINSLGLYATYRILSLEIKSESGEPGDKIAFSMLGGATFRRLGGDYGLNKNRHIQTAFLGTTDLGFNGWELGALLELGSFYGRMSLTGFPKKHDIEGFSGNQVLITLGLNADLNIVAKDTKKK